MGNLRQSNAELTNQNQVHWVYCILYLQRNEYFQLSGKMYSLYSYLTYFTQSCKLKKNKELKQIHLDREVETAIAGIMQVLYPDQ